MLAPLSWLCDYADLDRPVDELASALSGLGLVVEGVTRVGATRLDGVVVARILDIRAHPKADRIRLVDIDSGDGETHQIVCGAWNMEVGDLVPLATIGTTLPGGMEIARRKMRGEWSEGMLCAASEVDLPAPGGDGDGLLILPAGVAPPGTPLGEALELRPDVVFDLDITPNRPDALCMAGVARDLAAALGVPWSVPSPGPSGPAAQPPGAGWQLPPVDSTVEVAPVRIEALDLCPRFTATVLEGVPSGPSPAWLARRLALAGMRPINAVVDVSNYVMLDVGQPNHAYDLSRLGGRGILVRRADPGEQITTLDGVTRALDAEDCLICDAEGTPVGVGGIMGGADSEISAGTSTVLLEAAFFSPLAVGRTGKRLGLSSEARTRFERGVDPSVAPLAVERFASLLGPSVRRGATTDVRDESLGRPRSVRVRTDRVNAVLGVSLTDGDVARLLAPIGFTATPAGAGSHEVALPSWRPDAEREIDVIEEVARLHGYGRIDRTVPSGIRPREGLTAYQRARREVRQILAGAGLNEAWTTTFLAPGDLERAGLEGAAVEVENPLDRSESILRTALLPGLLKAVRFNVDRQSAEVGLFEIGHVFALPARGDLPEEREHLATVVAGPSADGTVAARLWTILAGALRLDGVSLQAESVPGLHRTRAARLVGHDGVPLGAVGEVDPDVVAAYGLSGRIGWLELDLSLLIAHPRLARRARPVSRFPAADMDLAFVVPDDVPAASVASTLSGAGGDLLESVRLFDVYRHESLETGRSLAYRLRFRAPDRTLDDAELARLRQAAIDAVTDGHGARLRS